jgi:hypothetical protein
MMRWLAALLGVCVVGLPLLLTPAAVVAVPAAIAAALIAAGVLLLHTPLITAGSSVALIAYGLALVLGHHAPEPLSAVAMGEALLLLIQVVHFAGRVRGVDVSSAVVAFQIRYWLRVAIVAMALGLGVSAVAMRVALPAVAAPMLAAAGAIAALAAATRLARRAAAVEEQP